MALCIPWGFAGDLRFESRGILGLAGSVVICLTVGFMLRWFGKNASDIFYRKEAIATVALSWILATLLGAMPYLLSGSERESGAAMTIADALFESQSGFSTTGGSVINELENPATLPRCILFWRMTTHFLGGLGIMVLFVALLGQNAINRMFMKLEMSGKGLGMRVTVQQTALLLFTIYVVLNVLATIVLLLLGLNVFDAISHAFSIIATGGFSTRNASAGFFAANGYRYAAAIEWVMILFMFISSCNFTLLYFVCIGRPLYLLRDVEWRSFVFIITVTVIIVFVFGLLNGDFNTYDTNMLSLSDATINDSHLHGQQSVLQSLRTAAFQVVSIITTTGLLTNDYSFWHPVSYALLILIMFIGGCTGSTAGGVKVIRYVIATRIIGQEIERSYRPNIVRPLMINGDAIDQNIVYNVLVFFITAAFFMVTSTIIILFIEPASLWKTGGAGQEAAYCISTVTSMMNNVGPSFGVIGTGGSYAAFSDVSKIIFTWLMILGRLEFFIVLSLFQPGFWNSHG
ncbi:MAG: TrkH family potassium uptake protein [Planctomycetaceae bacterium]|nr:TrkH family potassium uptake protein [Planctomycetaceae bacterium]